MMQKLVGREGVPMMTPRKMEAMGAAYRAIIAVAEDAVNRKKVSISVGQVSVAEVVAWELMDLGVVEILAEAGWQGARSRAGGKPDAEG